MQPNRTAPSLQRIGLWVDVFLAFAILISCSTVVVDLWSFSEDSLWLHKDLLIVEGVFTVLFSIEYLLRWYASPNRLTYPFGKYAIIDFVAILPSLLTFAHVAGLGSGFLMLRTVRVLRMLRIARFLRLVRVRHGGRSMYRAAVIAKTWTLAIIFRYRLRHVARILLIVVFAWVAGANALFLFERMGSDPGNPSPYLEGTTLWDAYWDSYWWVNIYLVSGFDAPTPVTWAARVAATTLLLAGVLVTTWFEGEVVTMLVKSAERRGRLATIPPGLKLEDHVVILGRNDHLEKIITEVHQAYEGNHYILVVCEDAESIQSPGPLVHSRVFALNGNPARDDVLTTAAIESAKRVIVLSCDGNDRDNLKDKDGAALMHALAAIAKNRTAPLVIELHDPRSQLYASSIETADCVVSREFGEMLISQSVHQLGITDIYDELLTFDEKNNELRRIPTPQHLVGKTFRQAQEYFLDCDTEAILPLGVARKNTPAFESIQFCVQDEAGNTSIADYVLLESDRLIVFAVGLPIFDTGEPEDVWTANDLPRV